MDEVYLYFYVAEVKERYWMCFVRRTAGLLNSDDSHFDGEVMWCGVLERFVFVWCHKSLEEAEISSLSAI